MQITLLGAALTGYQRTGAAAQIGSTRGRTRVGLTTSCHQRQTQLRMRCLAKRQALADSGPLKVIADCGLEKQPRP